MNANFLVPFVPSHNTCYQLVLELIGELNTKGVGVVVVELLRNISGVSPGRLGAGFRRWVTIVTVIVTPIVE